MTEKGGTPYDKTSFNEDTLRAQLCELAFRYSLKSGHKLVDELLEDYAVSPKYKYR